MTAAEGVASFHKFLSAMEMTQTREQECTAERAALYQRNDEMRQERAGCYYGQSAAALVWVYFHSDSSMCDGAALGHLSLL